MHVEKNVLAAVKASVRVKSQKTGDEDNSICSDLLNICFYTGHSGQEDYANEPRRLKSQRNTEGAFYENHNKACHMIFELKMVPLWTAAVWAHHDASVGSSWPSPLYVV